MTSGAIRRFLRAEGRQWPVRTLKEASEKYCAVRDRLGVGASQMPPVVLVDQHGTQQFYISYNGRVWHGHHHDYAPGRTPAYDNAPPPLIRMP